MEKNINSWKNINESEKIKFKKFISKAFIIFIILFLFWWFLAVWFWWINNHKDILALFIMPWLLVLPSVIIISIKYYFS